MSVVIVFAVVALWVAVILGVVFCCALLWLLNKIRLILAANIAMLKECAELFGKFYPEQEFSVPSKLPNIPPGKTSVRPDPGAWDDELEPRG